MTETEFENALAADSELRYVLRLYVAGASEKSAAAIAGVRAICDELLAGRCELQVVDVYREPALAQQDRILATPTLLRREPLPERRLVGALSDRDKLLAALDIRAR
jgi:circadian clock protein KaiB